MDNSIVEHPDTFAYWKERCLEVSTRIAAEYYYLPLWERVKTDFDTATTKEQLLKPFQDFWEALPDSPNIRRGVFFDICNLAEEYCFGSQPHRDAAERTIAQVTAKYEPKS